VIEESERVRWAAVKKINFPALAQTTKIKSLNLSF
jgi:hypothetical protein